MPNFVYMYVILAISGPRYKFLQKSLLSVTYKKYSSFACEYANMLQ